MILAEGGDFASVIAWITDHAGMPESNVAAAPSRGLHGARVDERDAARQERPLRYVLPAGALHAWSGAGPAPQRSSLLCSQSASPSSRRPLSCSRRPASCRIAWAAC